MKRSWFFNVGIVLVLLLAGYLRFVGINWDADQHLHPDERFLTDVETRIQPVDSLAGYFDTAKSSLNPNNHNLSFFVYGTLPIFLVRYTAEWIGQTGYDQIHLIGRALSALADLGVVLLVYAIAARLFDRRVGLLAASFSALTVVQIQQSHYFTVDNFTNLFSYLAIFFAVRMATSSRKESEKKSERILSGLNPIDFILFGFALGLAVASKVSAAPLALMLPIGLAIFLWQIPAEERNSLLSRAALYTLVSAFISLVVFRIAQPYAFSGPGFFNISLNPQWVDTLRQLSAQVSGDVDWPPSMQWARRPIWFAFQNMTLWGMGLPLAIVSWGGFGWAAWRLFKKGWMRPQLLLLGWGTAYFAWQSLAFNPTMRYLLPVYPTLAVFAAVLIFYLWDKGTSVSKDQSRWRKWARPSAVLLAAIALVGSALWAFAFVQIYRSPITRLEATRWIFNNLAGPLTLIIDGQEKENHQPLPFPRDYLIEPEKPYFTSFSVKTTGSLEEISLHHVLAPIRLQVTSVEEEEEQFIAQGIEIVDLLAMEVGASQELILSLPTGIRGQHQLKIILPAGEGQMHLETIELHNSQNAEALAIALLEGEVDLSLGESFELSFSLDDIFLADQIRLRISVQNSIRISPVEMHLSLSSSADMGTIVAEAQSKVEPTTNNGGLIEPSLFVLDQAVAVEEGQVLYLELDVTSGSAITLLGSAVVNETSWDDGLPRRMDGYDAFGGIYQGDLNFEMYWDADPAKLERFLTNLEQGEYIFISSSRQWASLPRIPERFPLVSSYYRLLLGCPDDRTIEWCYTVAGVGDFEGQLGYELVQVFNSSPELGALLINDQAAEEAFTVYDHPKVFIFQKSADYDHERVTTLLTAVDLDEVVHVTPKQASGRVPPNLMLPESRWDAQRAGGTWYEIFDSENWINASPWVSAAIWYLALGLLGLAVFPLLRMALPGLEDGGYPFARLAGLLLLSYLGWMGGSLGLSFSRAWLAAFAVLLALAGLSVAYRKREELRKLWQEKRAYFIRVELLFLAFFLLMLLIRWANPDLWHPGKGGEKPMDFAYFNAVLKSSSFPAYDPWFSGGYINYYYYGFVLVGSLTKLLGIIPSVAYNLILPALFTMLALGAFSIAWNIFSAWKKQSKVKTSVSPIAAGLSAAVGMVLLSNLGSLQMIFQGYQRLGAEGAFSPEAGLFTRWLWAGRGFMTNLLGESLPFGLGEWYWNPTRIIPAPDEIMPITEFPLFTFVYADLHAHMLALPLTLLALAWAASAIFSRAWKGARSPLQLIWIFAFGGIAIGSLRPTNTWDFPTYLVIGVLAVVVAIWQYWPRKKEKDGKGRMPWLQMMAGAVLLVSVSVLAYKPFADWYRQGFTSLEIWRGSHTPTWAYVVHWGVFLFFIAVWMIWETRQWLASTPLSSLRKLEPYRYFILAALILLLGLVIGLVSLGAGIAWFVLPLMLLAGLLIMRPGQPKAKRLVLFLAGTGLFLTLMVEVIVLQGDVSRMNTVFKFYEQVWVLFVLSAALGFAWTLTELREWLPSWQRLWQISGAILIASSGLFLLLGVSAKVQDRMTSEAPRTLDGMAYMQYAIYYDKDQALELDQDYEAIRWLQENVEGSPVIVEAHTGEYKWGSRITIYTGLPSVIGWNWHQRQQREFVPGNDIWARVGDVAEFYETSDLNWVKSFLQEYDVSYIVLGQLERAYYPGSGLEKFEEQAGLLWQEVFRFEDTVILEVLNDALAQE